MTLDWSYGGFFYKHDLACVFVLFFTLLGIMMYIMDKIRKGDK